MTSSTLNVSSLLTMMLTRTRTRPALLFRGMIFTRQNQHEQQRQQQQQQQQRHALSTLLTSTRSTTTPSPSSFFLTSSSSSSSSSFRSFSTSVSQADRDAVMERVDWPQTSVSLQALMSTGRGEFLHKTFAQDRVAQHAATDLVLLQVASFLQRELPIRFAHRVRDLEAVPALAEQPSVQGVRDLYIQSGVELLQTGIHKNGGDTLQTPEDEEQFAKLVESIYERHANVLVQMARGAFEFRKQLVQSGTAHGQDAFVLQNQIHAFLDRFYMSRIGIRVLIGQYLALRQPPVETYVGIICSRTSPYEIVKRAIDDAAFMCTRKYGDAPEVIMSEY